jgi:ATP-dependent exoDNAse (exonuclease V) alpha subunit
MHQDQPGNTRASCYTCRKRLHKKERGERTTIQHQRLLPNGPLAFPTEHLQGIVEHVTFHAEDSGYTVARLKVPSHSDLVTVVGCFASISAGQTLSITGFWREHPRFGQSDCLWLEAPEPILGAADIGHLVREYLPKHGIDPVQQVQVLCPTTRGEVGTRQLNSLLQQLLNPAKPVKAELSRGGSILRVGIA